MAGGRPGHGLLRGEQGASAVDHHLRPQAHVLLQPGPRRLHHPHIPGQGRVSACRARCLLSCVSVLHLLLSRLESVFYKYGVDIILEAHEHSYERLWPVYNEVVTAKDYINPKAPIHLISGTAGCSEGVDPTLGPRGEGHAALLTVVW